MSQLTGNMKRITRRMRLFKNEKLQPYDLVMRQAEMLTAIRYCNSQDQLADVLMINKSNVARHLTVLEERGLVRRQPNPENRRETQVFLTEEGAALIPSLLDINRQWHELVTAPLTKEEAETLQALLQKILQHLKGADGQ